MRHFVLLVCLLSVLKLPASALEIEAPKAPDFAQDLMPEDTSDFGESLLGLLQKAVDKIQPDLADARKTALSIAASVMLVSLVKAFPTEAAPAELAGTAMIALSVLSNMNALVCLGANTVVEMSEYGKLLLPVMTAAMAAQGSAVTSAALYTGTALFDTLLSRLISRFLVPMVYLYLAAAVANSALGDDVFKKMRDFIKWFISWCLKMTLTVFTTYISITGVVSGTTDAVALKAAKVTISSVVPVVGGILSDASEAVLVSAGLMKNAAGIYGILAVLAICIVPFLRIGVHYLVLKVTAAICSLFGARRMTDLVEDISAAMGLLLAMTGSVCMLLLISTICFLKGVG